MVERRIRRVAHFAGLALVLGACSAPSASPSPSDLAPSRSPEPSESATYTVVLAGEFDPAIVEGLSTVVDVPFTDEVACGRGTCAVPLDVLAPTEAESLPTIVLLPGGPGDFHQRRYMELLAAGLAQAGAVVFLATYRSMATGNAETEALNDIRCAIGFARSATAEYGGDPQRVVLVGHSFGSDLSLKLALSEEMAGTGCLADSGAMPDAVVGLAGFSIEVPDTALASPPLWLGAASDDPYSAAGASTTDGLRAAGFEVEFREFADTTHVEMVEPAETPGLLDFIFQAVDGTAT